MHTSRPERLVAAMMSRDGCGPTCDLLLAPSECPASLRGTKCSLEGRSAFRDFGSADANGLQLIQKWHYTAWFVPGCEYNLWKRHLSDAVQQNGSSMGSAGSLLKVRWWWTTSYTVYNAGSLCSRSTVCIGEVLSLRAQRMKVGGLELDAEAAVVGAASGVSVRVSVCI